MVVEIVLGGRGLLQRPGKLFVIERRIEMYAVDSLFTVVVVGHFNICTDKRRHDVCLRACFD